MSSKHKREKAERKDVAESGLTVARVVDVLKDLPGEAKIMATDSGIAVYLGDGRAAFLDNGGIIEVDG